MFVLEIVERRKFFFHFAKEIGFDFKEVKRWYGITSAMILNKKGGPRVLETYHGSLPAALIDIFPDLGLQPNKFLFVQIGSLEEIQNQREFFDRVAQDMNFNPLDAKRWYRVTANDVRQRRGGFFLMDLYDRSHVKALVKLYPELQLQPKLFYHTLGYNFTTIQSRRNFLNEFAHDLGFNPLEAEHWYNLSSKDFRNRKGGIQVISHHKSSHIQALMEIYPHLHWENQKFHKYKRSNKGRREIFDKLAKDYQ